MWDTNPVDAYLAAFIGVLDAALGYLEPPIFGLYDTLMILGIAALSVFLLRGGRAYFDRLGPRVLYLGGLGFILDNFGTIAQAIANSFVFLGLTAGGGQMAEYTFWHPGLLAQFGWEAAAPLRKAATELSVLNAGNWELIVCYGLAAFLGSFAGGGEILP
jgi:type IV secretory pathway TrbL component